MLPTIVPRVIESFRVQIAPLLHAIRRDNALHLVARFG